MDELWDGPIDEDFDGYEEGFEGDFPEDLMYLECGSCGGNWYTCGCPLDDTYLPF